MRINKLLKGEFKGQSFLWKKESEAGGRKLVIKSLPNTDRNSIQDLGGLPPKFTLTIIIHGEDFVQLSKKFRRLLNEEGVGDLVLPTFGKFEAYAETFQRNTNINNVGVVAYDVNFVLEKMDNALDDDDVTDQDVYNAYLASNDALNTAVKESWKEPDTNKNYQNAVDDTKSFFDKAKTAVKTINEAVDKIDDIADAIETGVLVAETYAELLVSDGVFATVASLTGLGSSYRNIKDMIDFGKDLPDRLRDLANIVDDAEIESVKDFNIPLWDEITEEWEDRNNNRIVTVEANRLGCLQALFADVVNLNIETFDDLNVYLTELQTWFDEISSYSNTVLLEDQAYYSKLLDLKNTAFGYLNNLQESVFYKNTVIVSNMPALVLSQRLYGEESRAEIERRAEILKRLNDGAEILDGVVTILER